MADFSEKELFESVPVPQAVATLAIPTVISQVVTMIYNLADTFFVGQIGDPYMVAAVSLVSPWFNLLTALGNGYYSAAKGALELASEALAKEVTHLGIRVMLAEPGALRTGFYGARLGSSALTIPDYDALAEQYRKSAQTDRHDQPGDPDRAGTILVETALRPDAPFRLLLGSDAVQTAVETLENRLLEARSWAEVSDQSDFFIQS